MRKVTRSVAFDDAWDGDRAKKVAALFDSLALEWSGDHATPERRACIIDAIERGDVPQGLTLELGSGTGLGTEVLREIRGGPIVALDLSPEMLANAPATYGSRVRGDAAALPIRDASVAALVLVNALLFPREANRVLAPGGVVVWVNTLGDQTPIHLSADDVVAALGGAWDGVAGRAGSGTWAAVRRTN